MRVKVIFSLVMLVAIAALAAGCGGSSDSSSTGADSGGTTSSASGDGTTGGDGTTQNASGDGESDGGKSASGKPLTKAEFIKEGEAICGKIPEEYEEKRQELLKGKEKNNASTAKVNEVAAIPPIFVAVESFEKLTPPEGEEAEVEAIIKALEAAGKGLEKEPNAPLVGPESPYDEFQKLTKKYGLQFCSEL